MTYLPSKQLEAVEVVKFPDTGSVLYLESLRSSPWLPFGLVVLFMKYLWTIFPIWRP